MIIFTPEAMLTENKPLHIGVFKSKGLTIVCVALNFCTVGIRDKQFHNAQSPSFIAT